MGCGLQLARFSVLEFETGFAGEGIDCDRGLSRLGLKRTDR